MANAAAGEPLGYRHAVVLWSAQAVQGTPATPAAAAGLAQVRLARHGSTARFRGPGSPGIVARKGGETWAEWSLRFPAVQSGGKNLLLKALRGGGVLPWLTLGLGYEDDSVPSVKAADQVQDCKIERLSLSLEAGRGHAPLTAEISGAGGLVTSVTTLTRSTLSSAPWMTYEAVIQQEALAFPCRSLELEVEHDLRREHLLPGAAPAVFPRGWRYLSEGMETIRGRISRYVDLAADVQGAAVETVDISLLLTSLDDAATLSLTLTGVDYDTRELEEDEEGIFWSWSFEASGWSLA